MVFLKTENRGLVLNLSTSEQITRSAYLLISQFLCWAQEAIDFEEAAHTGRYDGTWERLNDISRQTLADCILVKNIKKSKATLPISWDFSKKRSHSHIHELWAKESTTNVFVWEGEREREGRDRGSRWTKRRHVVYSTCQQYRSDHTYA